MSKESTDQMLKRTRPGQAEESVVELQCNVDDMSGEAVGCALEKLLSEGALDAWWTPIGMKKSRPGLLLSVLCREGDRERMAELLFRHTSTIGVRESLCRRYVLQRRAEQIETAFGPVRVKRSVGYGVERLKAESDDLTALCDRTGLSLEELKAQLPLK